MSKSSRRNVVRTASSTSTPVGTALTREFLARAVEMVGRVAGECAGLKMRSVTFVTGQTDALTSPVDRKVLEMLASRAGSMNNESIGLHISSLLPLFDGRYSPAGNVKDSLNEIFSWTRKLKLETEAKMQAEMSTAEQAADLDLAPLRERIRSASRKVRMAGTNLVEPSMPHASELVADASMLETTLKAVTEFEAKVTEVFAAKASEANKAQARIEKVAELRKRQTAAHNWIASQKWRAPAWINVPSSATEADLAKVEAAIAELESKISVEQKRVANDQAQIEARKAKSAQVLAETSLRKLLTSFNFGLKPTEEVKLPEGVELKTAHSLPRTAQFRQIVVSAPARGIATMTFHLPESAIYVAPKAPPAPFVKVIKAKKQDDNKAKAGKSSKKGDRKTAQMQASA